MEEQKRNAALEQKCKILEEKLRGTGEVYVPPVVTPPSPSNQSEGHLVQALKGEVTQLKEKEVLLLLEIKSLTAELSKLNEEMMKLREVFICTMIHFWKEVKHKEKQNSTLTSYISQNITNDNSQDEVIRLKVAFTSLLIQLESPRGKGRRVDENKRFPFIQ